MTVSLPIFESIVVEGYGLYPGPGGLGGLRFDFASDENLILGVNGLGKSTLLLLLKQMIEGPRRLRAPGFVGEGTADLLSSDSNMFAVRGGGSATVATATLTVLFGSVRLLITRRLSDLALQRLEVARDGAAPEQAALHHFEAVVTEVAGVGTFADVVRVCDRVVFFLENRERLLWDWRVQYEVFRSLLLPGPDSGKLQKLEKKIITSDSSARNLRYAMGKASTRRAKELQKRDKAKTVAKQLEETDNALEIAQERERDLVERLDAKRNEISDERARVWKEQSDTDAAEARYDHLKYSAIRHALGNVDGQIQYALLKLIDEGHCIVCDTGGLETLASELDGRRKGERCLLCGSPLSGHADVATTSGALSQQAQAAFADLKAQRARAEGAQDRLSVLVGAERSVVADLSDVRSDVDRLQRARRYFRGQLPADDKAFLSRVDSELDNLSSSVEGFQKDRDEAEAEAASLIARLASMVLEHRAEIERVFKARASDFFIEQVQLIYAPRTESISQGGRRFQFPAFEVELTSGSTGESFVRRTYEQASLSQREYLDIAFRMAVMETFGDERCSIVVDGPEGSVDVVFAERAGRMLANYAHPVASGPNVGTAAKSRQIIVACNVVEGGFIPWFFRDHPELEDRRRRTVNLLEIAYPTAALSKLRTEYVAKVDQVIARVEA